jgi:hypothetical protein
MRESCDSLLGVEAALNDSLVPFTQELTYGHRRTWQQIPQQM